MESEILDRKPTQRGVAMLVVLSMIVFFTMLGYMGIEMAGRDTEVSGTYLDITSRDVAGRSALQYALARLNTDGARTMSQLQLFVDDSSKPIASVHQYLNLSQATCSLQVADPGFLALGTGGDQSAVKVQVLSADLGSDAAGSANGDGIRLTLLVTGRGRNGDVTNSVSSYQIMGVDVPSGSSGAPSLDNAIYVNGGLPSTNVGNQVTGNMYVAGDAHFNGPATVNVSGMLRVNGDLSSDASLISVGNAVIGGDLNTNATAPMTFQKSIVIQGGLSSINGPVTVNGNMEVQSNPTVVGNWNATAPLVVAGQYWEKTMCHAFGAKMTISGNAFFDNCLLINAAANTHSFSNVYIARAGGTTNSEFKAGTINISGNLGSWATGGKFLTQSTATTTVTGNLQLKPPLDIGGAINVTGAIQLFAGIADIRLASPTALNGGTSTFLNANGQRGNFAGGVTLNGPFTSKGSLDAAFSNTAGNSRWSINAGAGDRTWKYENGSAFSTGLDPRVLNGTSNAGSWNATGSLPTPADLLPVPTPVAATAYASPYSANDLDLSPTKTWNQVYTVDSNALKAVWTNLTDAAVTAASTGTNNWTIANMNAVYNKYKQPNGWLIAHIPATGSSLGALNTPGGTFSGKAIWIVDKTLDVNGNWPGSTSTSDIQMIYVRGSGIIKNFGSPSDFTGYIHIENPFTGQMKWGTGSGSITLTGALHLKGNPTNLTGNGGNLLKVVGSQVVMDQIQAAVPGILDDPGPGGTASGLSSSSGGAGASGQLAPVSALTPYIPTTTPTFGATSGSTRKLVMRQPRLQFNRLGEFR